MYTSFELRVNACVSKTVHGRAQGRAQAARAYEGFGDRVDVALAYFPQLLRRAHPNRACSLPKAFVLQASLPRMIYKTTPASHAFEQVPQKLDSFRTSWVRLASYRIPHDTGIPRGFRGCGNQGPGLGSPRQPWSQLATYSQLTNSQVVVAQTRRPTFPFKQEQLPPKRRPPHFSILSRGPT